MPTTRRELLQTAAVSALAATMSRASAQEVARPRFDLARQLGVTTGSFVKHLSKKMNQKDLDMASPDADTRKRALDEYRRSIDAAQRLGCRWVRPLPSTKRPDFKWYAAAYRDLIEYAKPRGIELLIENNAWMQDDPSAIPQVIQEVGAGLHAQPDTGNWTAKSRYDGLRKAFPLAVTCDFKAKEFGPNSEHPAYDLHRCFTIGWQSGFRGPWCFEHAHEELPGLWRGLIMLRDLLRKWMESM